MSRGSRHITGVPGGSGFLSFPAVALNVPLRARLIKSVSSSPVLVCAVVKANPPSVLVSNCREARNRCSGNKQNFSDLSEPYGERAFHLCE